MVPAALPRVREVLSVPRLEPAIGVIHRQIHIDHSGAIEPLERASIWDAGEPPETYPSGFSERRPVTLAATLHSRWMSTRTFLFND
jgi:hypothetical protein